ncbi:hypothetical protein FHQ08_11715 [Lactobacillus sp. CC-MHH1034]|uniref:hypothetical protein n=1 Tax=Agrilactobacillus fermenti TaxID=2586909 RepID=UPI001E3DAAB2|nr:hypothetical protein [Agrilactobacillus fermenti]MCD2257352.1 hypothetical protein [Agrilactobacillus fermenti]
MRSKKAIGLGLIAILLLLVGGSYYYHKNYQNKYGYQYHSIQDTKRMARRLSQIDRTIDDLETEQNQIEAQRQFNPDDRDLSLNQTSWQKSCRYSG